jgi:hypothetical protein
MNQQLIFWPVLLQILLTIYLFIPLAQRKKAAIRAGKYDKEKSALDNAAWPDPVVQVSNNLQNQFQAPVLFYVLCMMLYVIQGVDWIGLMLAWTFVGLRIVHSRVHITSNYIPHRFRSFAISLLVLLLLFAWVVVKQAGVF